MRSAFGIDHGGVSKAYAKIAGRLASAAAHSEPGTAEHAYAMSRIGAGSKAKGVAENLRQAKAPTQPGVRNFIGNQRIKQNAKSATVRAQSGMAGGRNYARTAQRTAGKVSSQNYKAGRATGGSSGIATMEANASQRMASNASRSKWKTRAKFGALGGAGAAAGGGGGYLASRKRSA